MKANKKDKQSFKEIIEPTAMTSVMADDFGRYAKAVLLERAIPDVRDGLKPVQRRIIFGMNQEGNTFDRQTKKCATTVGYVMGNYHPHGDASIYDALVRLSQDWKMEAPLVTFQGNNGSIDDDPPAASRYTEAKLSEIAGLLVADLDKNTVNMTLNFSDELLEPTVLPARFPNLLVNGAQGIAVGAVTNIPTHNLGEVIDATIYAISHKRATVQDLRKFIVGPDFPTGGVIDQKEELDKLYETGSATFYIHATCDIDKDKNQIIITGLPYGTIKSDFVANLDKSVKNFHIDNIMEVRDESAVDVRIVLDVKPGQDPAPILSYLRQKGLLRQTFAANMLAIDKGHPKTMNVLEITRAYIDHQTEVISRRSKFDLAADSKRLEVVEGLIKATEIIDQIIKVIKASSGKAESKDNIIKAFGFTPDQAEAIVMLNLYKLSNLDFHEYVSEKDSLGAEIAKLNDILTNPEVLDKLMIADLKDVKSKYAKPRKTLIKDDKIKLLEVDATSLISKEDVYAVLSKDGYLKRTNMRSYQASITGNPADDLPKIKPGDGIVLNQKCSTHDGILAFLSSGTFIYIPVYLLPEAKWKEEGKHISTMLRLNTSSDKVVSAFVVTTFAPHVYLAFLTAEGKIKRTLLKEYEQTKLTPHPIKAMGLSKGDSLCRVAVTTGNSDLVICQSNGYVSRYNEGEVPAVSIKAGGVKAINLGKGLAPLCDLLALASDEHCRLLILADELSARLVMSTNIASTPRLALKECLVRIFKGSKMDIVSICKADAQGKGPQGKSICVYTDDSNEIIDIGALQSVLPGSGMKPNVPLEGKKLRGLHVDGGLIDENIRLETPLVRPEEVKAEKDTGAKQLSLFDLFEEEKKQ